LDLLVNLFLANYRYIPETKQHTAVRTFHKLTIKLYD
jgi:hypothetical protein